jgi:hypothetical protein
MVADSRPFEGRGRAPVEQPVELRPSSQPVVVLPLTSFVNTSQNVASIAFLLGALFSLGLTRAWRLPCALEYGWPSLDAPSSGGQLGLAGALQSPVLGLYAAFWAVFHMLEYVVTATWNAPKAKVDCTFWRFPSCFSQC